MAYPCSRQYGRLLRIRSGVFARLPSRTSGRLLWPLPTMLETLRQAAKDPNEYVQRAALEDVSLQQLLENYWSRPDAILIPYITTRLYHTPLVVGKNTREDHQQVILYTTTVEPPGKWEQPQEVVEHFVHLIQAEARQPEQRFFYQVGKSVWEPLFWRCRC